MINSIIKYGSAFGAIFILFWVFSRKNKVPSQPNYQGVYKKMRGWSYEKYEYFKENIAIPAMVKYIKWLETMPKMKNGNATPIGKGVKEKFKKEGLYLDEYDWAENYARTSWDYGEFPIKGGNGRTNHGIYLKGNPWLEFTVDPDVLNISYLKDKENGNKFYNIRNTKNPFINDIFKDDSRWHPINIKNNWLEHCKKNGLTLKGYDA
jgi:hypothetical protein